eukprot:8695892-Alexandrium_andersonii.AAC.1
MHAGLCIVDRAACVFLALCSMFSLASLREQWGVCVGLVPNIPPSRMRPLDVWATAPATATAAWITARLVYSVHRPANAGCFR